MGRMPMPDDTPATETPPHVPLSLPEGYSPDDAPAPTPPPPAPAGTPWGRIGSAFREGLNSTGPVSGEFTPETTAEFKRLSGVDRWPAPAQEAARAVNRYVIRPGVYDISLAWHAMLGLLAGSQAAVAQAGEEIGQPKLGRDLAALPEAFPFGFRSGAPGRAVAEMQRARELRQLPQEAPSGPAKALATAAEEHPIRSGAEASRSMDEQRAFIRDDVKRQLIRAGRPAAEAEDIAELEATHYLEWSRWFGGALGSAEDLYRAESAEVLGPGQRSSQPGHPPTGVIGPGVDPDRVTGMTERFEGYRPVITAFEKADSATVIHEKGHEWFEQLLKFGQHEAAPEDFKATVAKARDWVGMTSDQERPTPAQHEKFARGFEQYLREGKAPSPEMASIFERFRQHLVAIYQTIRDLGRPISEDARQVFDRLLKREPQREPANSAEPIEDGHEWWHGEPAYMTPSEALAAFERLEQQRKETWEALPDDVRAKLEAEVARFESGQE